MKPFNANVVEEFGYKAHNKGFFNEWQLLTASLKESDNLPYDEAAEKAYNQLKLQGSE